MNAAPRILYAGRDFQVDLLTVRCKIAEFGAKNAGARAGFDL
jgi:hypothetical protein